MSPPPARRAWAVWSLAAALFCYAFFQRVAPSVMIEPLMRDLAVGGALLGNLSAFYFYAYAGLQVPVGLLHDRFGPRRLLAAGAVVAGIGSLVFAGADAVAAACLGRALIGAGAGFGFVGALKLATTWFPPERFARVSGLTMMAGMIGGILGQAPLAAVVDATGWRQAMAAAGGAGLVLAVAIWAVVRDRPPGVPVPVSVRGGPGLLAGLWRVVRAPRNWLLALACASMTAPLLAFAGLWGVAWLEQTHGFSRAQAAGTASLLLLGWAVGSPLGGAVSDRLGQRTLPLGVAAATGLACLAALVYLPALPAPFLPVLFLAAGLFFGAMVIGFAIAREMNDPETHGAAFGFLNGSVVATGAVFQPLIGWLLDLGWEGESVAGARLYAPATWRAAFAVLVVFLLAGLIAAWRLGEPRRR